MEKLLALGALGVQDEIRERMRGLDESVSDQQKRLKFYEACLCSLDGLMRFAERYAALAEDLAAGESDPQRRANLEAVAKTCKRVPAHPARTFREALQAAHFLMLCTETVEAVPYIVPGRMDRYLQTYLEADLASGSLTRVEAQELINCLFIGVNERTGPSGAVSVMVGGVDADERYVCNDITWMVLQAVEDVNLVYPNVAVAWHSSMPAALLDRACELMSLGRSDPAIFNDEVISAGMVALGTPETDRHEFINSTCVEITPVACSNVWVASPYFNLCQTLLRLLRAISEKEIASPASFDAFVEAWKDEMRKDIARAVAEQNSFRETRERFGGKPLQSCFTHDCLEKGRDIDQGGARCNWIECSFVGLANVADSLAVIRTFIYEARELSFPELVGVLEDDFKNHEPLRRMFLNGAPKYGNGVSEADDMARDVASFLIAESLRHRVRPGDARFVPGFSAS